MIPLLAWQRALHRAFVEPHAARVCGFPLWSIEGDYTAQIPRHGQRLPGYLGLKFLLFAGSGHAQSCQKAEKIGEFRAN